MEAVELYGYPSQLAEAIWWSARANQVAGASISNVLVVRAISGMEKFVRAIRASGQVCIVILNCLLPFSCSCSVNVAILPSHVQLRDVVYARYDQIEQNRPDQTIADHSRSASASKVWR